MFGYSRPSLFSDLENARGTIDSVGAEELQNWLQRLPETVVEKEPVDVLVLVFMIERLRGEGMLIGISGCSGSGKATLASLLATKLNAY